MDRAVEHRVAVLYYLKIGIEVREKGLILIQALFELEFVRDDLVLGKRQEELKRSPTVSLVNAGV